MKNFKRKDLAFSLCGLNCALCTMKSGGLCPGCGGGEGNQGCPIARCSVERGAYDYCCQCGDYPCGRYEGITLYNSFITHRNQLADMEKLKAMGPEAYGNMLREKAELLGCLLDNYNDGRRKTFFSLAVNLLELPELQAAIARLRLEVPDDAPIKVKAAAGERGITLKLNKNPPKARGAD